MAQENLKRWYNLFIQYIAFFPWCNIGNLKKEMQKWILHLSIGSTVIELGWVKCLTRVTSFFPFISIFLIFPFSLLVQNIFFQIQSTARPEICLSEQTFCNEKRFNEQAVVRLETSASSYPLYWRVPYLERHFKIVLDWLITCLCASLTAAL